MGIKEKPYDDDIGWYPKGREAKARGDWLEIRDGIGYSPKQRQFAADMIEWEKEKARERQTKV